MQYFWGDQYQTVQIQVSKVKSKVIEDGEMGQVSMIGLRSRTWTVKEEGTNCRQQLDESNNEKPCGQKNGEKVIDSFVFLIITDIQV